MGANGKWGEDFTIGGGGKCFDGSGGAGRTGSGSSWIAGVLRQVGGKSQVGKSTVKGGILRRNKGCEPKGGSN